MNILKNLSLAHISWVVISSIYVAHFLTEFYCKFDSILDRSDSGMVGITFGSLQITKSKLAFDAVQISTSTKSSLYTPNL